MMLSEVSLWPVLHSSARHSELMGFRGYPDTVSVPCTPGALPRPAAESQTPGKLPGLHRLCSMYGLHESRPIPSLSVPRVPRVHMWMLQDVTQGRTCGLHGLRTWPSGAQLSVLLARPLSHL